MKYRDIHISRKIFIFGCFILSIVLFSVFTMCSKLRNPFTGVSDNCGATDCHAATPLGHFPPVSGRHTAHLNSDVIQISCSDCHNDYNNNPLHKNGKKEGYNSGKQRQAGGKIVFFTGSDLDAFWDNSSDTCNSVGCHFNVSNLEWYSDDIGCTSCHVSGSMIDPVTINGSGTDGKHVKHVSDSNIPCTKCHLNYKDEDTHFNGILDAVDPSVDLVNFDSTNPSGTWSGDTGPQTGNCSSLACHGVDTLDWYTTNTWALPNCNVCHNNSIGNRRQVFGAGGDFAGNAARKSYHVTGVADPSADQCKVCHNMAQHTSGTVRLRNADTDAVIIFSSDNSSLEAFCLSCHDSDGAVTAFVAGGAALNPFNDGSTLGNPPYAGSVKIKESWSKTYGHGSVEHRTSENRLTCAGSGEPGTGCHGSSGSINAHGSVNEVLAAKEFFYSVNTGDGNYNEAWFTLCFDCHSSYSGITKEDILGVKDNGILDNEAWLNQCGSCHPYSPTINAFPPYYTSGVTTHFADHDEAGDPWGLNDGQIPGCGFAYPCVPIDNNLHWLHLGMYVSYFRGAGSSLVVCANCHSVHGSNTEYGAVHDTIGYTNISDGFGNTYGKMKDEAYNNPNVFQDYPTYCNLNCHEKTGVTRAWFSPVTE